jgi:hypothetical protein
MPFRPEILMDEELFSFEFVVDAYTDLLNFLFFIVIIFQMVFILNQVCEGGLC